MTFERGPLDRRHLLAGLAPGAALLASAGAVAEGAVAGNRSTFTVVRGDGTGDQTEEIQHAAGQGGGIYLQGTIRLGKPIVVELDRVGTTSIFGDGTARVLMAGAGPAFHFIGTHGGTAAPHTVKPNVWERQRMPCVDGFSIDGLHEQAGGILAEGTMGMILSRLHIRQCHHAVHLRVRNRNVIIEACHFYHNRGVGVYYDHVDLHQSNIGDSHISYNAGGGVVSRGGNVRNIHIGNCDLEGNHPPQTAPPSEATANVLIDCRDSKLGTAEVAITGCTIQHTARSPDSANVRIHGGEMGSRKGHVTITGNVFSDVRTNVHLDHIRGATITGNTFWMGYDHNFLIEGSAEIAVSSNNLNRSPRYGHLKTNVPTHDVVIRDSQDIVLSGSVITDVRQPEGAVRLERCRRMAITGCTIGRSDGPAISLDECHAVMISGCILGDAERKEATVIKRARCRDVTLGENVLFGNVAGT